MDSCVVCFKDSMPCIYVDSNEWHKCNIKPIIQKHLWWWHLKQLPSKKCTYICLPCWKMLSSFHTFYLEIEKLHQLYYVQNWPVLKGSFEKDNCELISTIDPKTMEKDIIICIANKNKIIELLPSKEKDDASNSTFDDDNTQEDQIYLSKNATSSEEHDNYLAQNSYQLFCDLCNIECNNFKDLKYHCRQAHNVSGYAVCCKKKFYNRGQFADHLRIHQNPNYFKCSICNRVLSHRLSYENHIKCHIQPKSKRDLTCVKCKKTFSKSHDYGRHILSDCKDDDRKSEYSNLYQDNTNFIYKNIETKELAIVKNVDSFIDERSDKIVEPVVKTERVSCFENEEPILFESYADSRNFLLSTTEQSNFMNISENAETKELCSALRTERAICSENGEIFNYTFIDESNDCEISNEDTSNIFEPLQKSPKKKTQKREMDEEYLDRGKFVDRLRLHENSYQPNKVCDKNVSANTVLQRKPKKLYTTEVETEQVCSICSKVSPDMKSHRQHIRYNHTEGLKHACHICEKKFRFPAKLKEHISTHTGIALHACPYCYRPFKSSSNMHTHRKRVHPKEWKEERIKRLAAETFKKQILSMI